MPLSPIAFLFCRYDDMCSIFVQNAAVAAREHRPSRLLRYGAMSCGGNALTTTSCLFLSFLQLQHDGECPGSDGQVRSRSGGFP